MDAGKSGQSRGLPRPGLARPMPALNGRLQTMVTNSAAVTVAVHRPVTYDAFSHPAVASSAVAVDAVEPENLVQPGCVSHAVATGAVVPLAVSHQATALVCVAHPGVTYFDDPRSVGHSLPLGFPASAYYRGERHIFPGAVFYQAAAYDGCAHHAVDR